MSVTISITNVLLWLCLLNLYSIWSVIPGSYSFVETNLALAVCECDLSQIFMTSALLSSVQLQEKTAKIALIGCLVIKFETVCQHGDSEVSLDVNIYISLAR